MSRTKKCKHKIDTFYNSLADKWEFKHINENADGRINQGKIEEKVKSKKNSKTREKEYTKEIRANGNKSKRIKSRKEEKKGNNKEKKQQFGNRQHYTNWGIGKNIINIKREGTRVGVGVGIGLGVAGWYGKRNERRHMQDLKEEVKRAIKNESRKESKRKENLDVVKYTQHNHIWYRHHTESLIDKPLTHLDDELSSLEFGWTKGNEIVLSDFRKKEEATPCEIDTNENLTNKELILETLSDYTSDFDELSINKFIDEHKSIDCDKFLNREDFLETDINKEKNFFNTCKSFQSNSRTLTFTASTDKYGHTCETKNFDVFENTLGFSKTLPVNEQEKNDSETNITKGKGKNMKYNGFGVSAFSSINNLNNDHILSDRITHFNKKKKSSFFCKGKVRLFSVMDYVKQKWSLNPFSKKKIPHIHQKCKSQIF